jgi:ectoine hydroxylase-related dioxygenase (phytanoyl-CoA dioxygenase family)
MPFANAPVFALTPAELESFARDGYLIVRQLLTPDEVRQLRGRFDALGEAGQPIQGWSPDTSPQAASNVLSRYPRVMMPHRFDELSRRVLLAPAFHDIVTELLGDEPLAAQSMFYFKPPGAKGQAFHQDDFYLRTKPASCIAAWIAIDPSLPENGGLSVVPGSHRLDVLCPDSADEEDSFTTHLVQPPPGMTAVPATLAPGDVLFFGGNLIHGSQPNRSALWRRSFICHYMARGSTHISEWFFPLLDFDGQVVERLPNHDGGPCGIEFK